ncbi:MAG: alpha/beta hydrolase [Pseudomonadota bacterium]
MTDTYQERYWTSADGLKLYFRDYAGPGGADTPSILCLHGLTRNSRDFADLAAHLCHRARVIVPEMRGRGKSEYAPSSETYNPKQYVEDVELLLKEEGIERFISIGTSMGGLMTMLLAAAKPGRLDALVMNDIGPEVNPAGIERISGYVGSGRSYPTWMHAARALCETLGDAFPDWDIEKWLEMAKRNMVVSQNGRITFDYDMAIAEPFQQAGNAVPEKLWLFYEALRDVPMLLVRGGLSDLLSEDTVKQMGVRNPAMRSVTVPGVGHAPTLDEPEVREAIDALLDSL